MLVFSCVRSLFSSYSPTAQMPGLVCNSCFAMCHYQVLPSTAGPSGGGGLVVEVAECISHEYSFPLGCTTKQKMARQRRLHPLKREGGWGQREERKEQTGRKDKELGKKRIEQYEKWWQTRRGEGRPALVAGIHKMIALFRGEKGWGEGGRKRLRKWEVVTKM